MPAVDQRSCRARRDQYRVICVDEGLLGNGDVLRVRHPLWQDDTQQVHIKPVMVVTNKGQGFLLTRQNYRVILSVLDPRKCEYLKDCSLDFEHAYMTTYLAS